MLDTYRAEIRGIAPLLMHNGQLADKTNPHTQGLAKLTAKTKKTADDMEEIARFEWQASLYLTPDSGRIAVPSVNILKAIIEGARASKRGKLIEAGVVDAAPFYELKYSGPTDLQALWDTGKFDHRCGVVVSRNRVIRTRPIFREWGLTIDLLVNTHVVDAEFVREALVTAGETKGLGDFRPRFGRFEVIQ
jgi:hypothetical protein